MSKFLVALKRPDLFLFSGKIFRPMRGEKKEKKISAKGKSVSGAEKSGVLEGKEVIEN